MAKTNTIKITQRDGFVWKIVNEQAKEIFNSGLFPLYELMDDDAESLIGDFDHLNECLEHGTPIGIEVGFTNYAEREKIEQLLKSHDFTYEYSDDARAYNRGRASLQEIHNLSQFIDRDDYIMLWNKYAPKNLQFVN